MAKFNPCANVGMGVVGAGADEFYLGYSGFTSSGQTYIRDKLASTSHDGGAHHLHSL